MRDAFAFFQQFAQRAVHLLARERVDFQAFHALVLRRFRTITGTP